jgi:hypothetical protein
MTAKPPLPTGLFDPWPRIPIDTTRSTDAERIIGLAYGAATDWALGPNGVYKQPGLPLAGIIHQAVEEALLHLLELGLIDIDTDRMHAAKGLPCRRGFQPDAPTTQES